MEIEDLKQNEIYYTIYAEGNDLIIFKFSSQINDNEFKSGAVIRNKNFDTENCYFMQAYLNNIRPATPEEKHWLQCCITADKFITQEEAMKSFKQEESLVGRWCKFLKDGIWNCKIQQDQLLQINKEDKDFIYFNWIDITCCDKRRFKDKEIELMPKDFNPMENNHEELLKETKLRYPLGTMYIPIGSINQTFISDGEAWENLFYGKKEEQNYLISKPKKKTSVEVLSLQKPIIISTKKRKSKLITILN